ncbi:hypothetical protein GCM10009550_18700 [Actinocorallia libanotica]|uniref:Uncharacterized protein n=1 Tax=Actinocorallia libanotica TaxID=46162 RepID=A0ABP4B2M5_9ACTN
MNAEMTIRLCMRNLSLESIDGATIETEAGKTLRTPDGRGHAQKAPPDGAGDAVLVRKGWGMVGGRGSPDG